LFESSISKILTNQNLLYKHLPKSWSMESSLATELDAQYRVLREEAGAFVRDSRRLVAVTGAEAAEYLQGQLTNDVEALGDGEGCYSALLDRKGHMQGDMRALRTADGFILDPEAVAADAVVRHLSMYKVGRDVEVAELGDRLALISVIGPGAAELALAGPAGPEHSHREVRIGATPARAVATDLGVDLLVAPDAVAAVLTELATRGVEQVDEAAAEIVRVESGRPRFGREMTTRTIPQEAGINERAVSFTKGCYIGQETVARLHYKGKPNRHLRGLRLEAAAAAGDPVRLGDRELGEIGTAVLSPARGPIALAILRREAKPGTKVAVGDRNAAEVVEPPF
jgi:folate-binding protein YgfZ